MTLLPLLLAGNAFAQESTGAIGGTVTDESGAVVPGTKLALESPTLPRGLQTTSNAYGHYVFQNVPIGIYALTAAKEGFISVKQQKIEVKLGSEITLNLRLAVGSVMQTVEVAEQALSIDVASSRTATNITVSQFDNLPKGRTFNTILSMAPGVILDDKASSAGVGGISVDGASGSENVFVIDGVDVTDIRSGALRAQNALPFQFVRELQVKSGGFEAEYGGANGGVVNVATRSGSNTFHGSLDFEFTNNQLNPRPRGYWQRSPLNAGLADFYAPKEDTYRTMYPGFSLGGPLVKNRLFFLVGYQPTFQRTERIIAYPAPTGTRQYMREDITHYGLGRLDYSPLDRLQLNASWMWTPYRLKGNYPATPDPRVAPPSNDLSIVGGFVPSNAIQTSVNYTATATTNISFRYGYRYLNDKGGNYGLPGSPYVIFREASASSAEPVPAGYAGPNGFTNVSSTLGIVRDLNIRKNLYLDASQIANLFGQQHIFKFGYMLNRVTNDIEDDYTNGRFDMYWGRSFSRGSINNVSGKYGYYIWEDGTRHKSKVNGRNQGLYVQDTWKVRSNLTLNLGIRLENEFLPPYTSEVNGIKIANPVAFGWTDKLAPRLGFAWDIMGDGKWKLASSFGLFYDVMKYELARTSFLGEYWFSNVYKLDSPNWDALGKANPGALGAKIISYDNRTAPINAQGEIDGIDKAIKPFTTREFTTLLERQLSSRTMLGIRYTRKDLLRTIEDIGVLDEEDNEVYLIGNPGFGDTRNTNSVYGQKTPNGNWLVPKAVRQYDAVEFRVQGNAMPNLNMLASYTWSRLYGNTSGLANSDESGRSQPGVSRMWDLPYYYFDETGSQENVLGRLGLDRPHTFKFFGNYDLHTKCGTTTFGLSQIAYSGTPNSSYFIYLSAPTYSKGRGDMGRTPFLTATDLGITQQVKLSERTTLKFLAQATNLFNQNAVINVVQQRNRSGAITDAVLPLSKFFAGYKTEDYVGPTKTNAAYNPIFGYPGGNYRAGGAGAYQAPRNIRLGVNIIF